MSVRVSVWMLCISELIQYYIQNVYTCVYVCKYRSLPHPCPPITLLHTLNSDFTYTALTVVLVMM